jgi:hypothetical protein
VSLLRDFENRLESIFEGFFAKQFKSGVQPVEIAKKLAREMDSNRTISVSKLYVPNRFTITVSEEDAKRLKQFEKDLVAELQSFLFSHAEEEGYDLLGRPRIEFTPSPELSLGEVIISSCLESCDTNEVAVPIEQTRVVRPIPYREKQAYLVRVTNDGETKIALDDRAMRIGRSADNHVVIPDPNVSRHHAQIDANGESYVLRDLNSTNGTLVNGSKVVSHVLKAGDQVTIGMTKFIFRSDAHV